MHRLFPAALLLVLLTACSRSAPQSFVPDATPSPEGSAAPARLDLKSLAALHAALVPALQAHLHDGTLDLAWPSGGASSLAGPYSDAPPEAGAAALQALRDGAPASSTAAVSTAVTEAYKQLDGPRGGAYLLLADAAHPAARTAPGGAETPISCPTPTTGGARPECLRKQVSDGLLAAWYARDTHMFFRVGETSTVYRPVDAIAVGAALLVAGFQLHDDAKIDAGTQVLQREMKTDLDERYGLLYGLVTATSAGGHSVTDYHARLADQAGAAEAMLEAFDYSREALQQGFAQKLLQPLLEEKFPARAASGGYISGFDLQASGPAERGQSDVFATLLTLQAARHYDRDDGGRFARLEETAAAALLSAVESDRKAGGDPTAGLPARLADEGVAPRSGITTAVAVTVLADVLRQSTP
ncbi:MAG: hypothetical protein NVSMB17_01660 [Candidatus Dormibacteria bacterium]